MVLLRSFRTVGQVPETPKGELNFGFVFCGGDIVRSPEELQGNLKVHIRSFDLHCIRTSSSSNEGEVR